MSTAAVAYRSEVWQVSAPEVSDGVIRAFVRDPANLNIVLDLAEQALVERREQRRRAGVRKVEQSSWRPKGFAPWSEAPQPPVITPEERAAETARREGIAAAMRVASDHAKRNIDDSIRALKDELHAEWSAELLKQEFDADGQKVSWAEATRDQHEWRLDWLKAHTLGTIKTAALHAKAIETLDAAGVSGLGKLEAAAA